MAPDRVVVKSRISLNRYTTIPNNAGDMPEATLRAILKQAGIDAKTFLQVK